jgi:glyoxylase I family protein
MDLRLSGTRLDHVGLSVRDLKTLTAWYVEALGLVEQAHFEYAIGKRKVTGVLLASADGWRLELQECEGSAPGQPANPFQSLLRQGLGHLCLRVPELDPAFALLVDRGGRVSIEPMQSPVAGVRFAYLLDPEGNLIELLEQVDVPDV